MRTTLLGALLVCLTCVVHGQAFYEDFESGVPGQFTQTYLDGTVDWQVNTGVVNGYSFPYSGSNSATFYYGGYTAFSTELESPDIDLSGGGDYDLTFQLVQRVWFGDQNELYVQISTDGGASWTQIAAYTSSIASWTQQTIDLDAAATLTANTRIKFIAVNDYGYATGLDEIRISCPSVSPSTSTITSSSALVTLSNAPATWDIEYGATGFSVGAGTRVTSLTGTTYTISGLSGLTTYDYYMRQSCDAAWDGPYTFSTALNAYPYFEDFPNSNVGWTMAGDFSWELKSVTESNGSSGYALYANFYSNSSGTANLYSPLLDLSGLTSPVANFYLAHASYSNSYDDELEIYISGDGGLTWTGAPVWEATHLGTPSLATSANTTGRFTPSGSGNWRHQTIDLSAYAGNSSVQIRFDGISGYGNDLHIDDFKIEDATSIYTATIGTAGAHSLSGLTVNLTNIGSGGELIIVRHDSEPTNFATPVFAANGSATTDDATVATPENLADGPWWVVTYEGDDKNGTPVYDISIDLEEFGFIDNSQQMYVLKRADASDSWAANNTTLSGNVVTATGFSGFSVFGAGGTGGALRIDLLEFTAERNGNVVILNWVTATEIDNSHFIIERSEDAVNWVALDQVTGQGTTYETTEYDWTDFAPLRGGAYYRLIDVEFNGRRTASDIAFVHGQVTGVDQPVLHPNPTPGSAWLTIPDPGSGEVTVVDAAGRLIQRLPVDGPGTIVVDLNQEAPGVYLVRFEHATGVWNTRLVRN